jgi:hypothetical protein
MFNGGMDWSNPPYPPPDDLERRAQGLAMLDAILSPSWEYRYFSFNAAWSEDSRMASARDGGGDESFIVFKDGSCVFKQFLHEDSSHLSLPEVLKSTHFTTLELTDLMNEFVHEPAFSTESLTELGWYQSEDRKWYVVRPQQTPDGELLFRMLFERGAADYIDWATGYFEVSLPRNEVEQVFQSVPLTPTLVEALNPDAEWEIVLGDAVEIGYPVADR